MSSWAHRYTAGEWQAVWSEIRSLETIAEHLWSDIDAVAEATMRRARPHIDRLAEAYLRAGLVADGTPIRTPAAGSDRRHLAQLQAEIGPLPSALRFCLTEIGGLWLAGDCPALGLYYDLPEPPPGAPVYPDPLVLPDVQWLANEWAEYLRLSIAWAGCAGWSLAPDRMPDPLRRLRVTPDF